MKANNTIMLKKEDLTLDLSHNQFDTPNKSSRRGKTPKFIVIHYSGAGNANLDSVVRGMNKASQKTSAHFVIDGRSICQVMPLRYSAWHVGNGEINKRYITAYLATNYAKTERERPENANSIGVEMCVMKRGSGKSVSDSDWYFTQDTIVSTARIVAFLMQKCEIPLARVIRHADVTGKPCPRPFVSLPSDGDDSNELKWREFKSLVKSILEKYDTCSS